MEGNVNVKHCSVIIPTLNAGDCIKKLLKSLQSQTILPDEIIVVDSQSEDDTVVAAASVPGVRVISIERASFDHGGTRDMALRQSQGEFVVFMTQDAQPTDEHCLERLLEPFKQERVAAVGGRQIAWPDARPFERLVRENNYPAQDRMWDASDIGRLGVRAYTISDVCAAYRRSAYLQSGGFDCPILTNEDMLMAERLLHAGYALAYSAGAAVYHSHHFSLRQEYARNYIIGRTMKRYEERFEHVDETGEGIALVEKTMRELLRNGHVLECFFFAANCAARLLGNRMGKRRETKERSMKGNANGEERGDS